jgi:hypothetical protein
LAFWSSKIPNFLSLSCPSLLLQPISYGSPNHAARLSNTAEIDETPVAEQVPFDFRDFVEVS